MKQQQARGKVRKFKGLVTEPIGSVSGSRAVKGEGAALRAEGAVEENHGKSSRKVGEFLKDQKKTGK